MLPDGLRDVVGEEEGMCSALMSEETPASIASIPVLPAPESTLLAAVSTVSGKKLTLSLPSTSRTTEAGQKLPTKYQL